MPQKIIDNFLKKEENSFIEEKLMDRNFPWFFQKEVNKFDKENSYWSLFL